MSKIKQMRFYLLWMALATYSGVQAAPASGSFATYQQAENAAFKHYVTNENQAFKDYKLAYQKAFDDYKRSIFKVWERADTTTAKTWVSYTPNFKQKTRIDFKKGTVTVAEVVAPNQSLQQAENAAYKRFEALGDLSYQRAYQEDQVAQKVDKRLKTTISPKLLKIGRASQQRVPVLAQVPKRSALKIYHIMQRHHKVVVVTYQLTPKDVSYRIKALLPAVIKQANRQQIEPALILAVVKNESAFNPLARSHIPAYGLMQIVPSLAGKDATHYLFGQPKLLSSQYLYSPENNLEIGAAYLHILYYRYLKPIKNPRARLYCVIAAYNTGAGNVAKSFTGSYSVHHAARVINSKSPKSVYNHLKTHLPYSETKHYLKRVSYSYFDYLKYFKKEKL